MNIKDSLTSISLLTISIFLGILGIVAIIRSFQEPSLIDFVPHLLFGAILLLLARFLYRKARRIREKAGETYKEK